ncbi:MAG: DegT/DnrJ/EryC1/StrS family aminotransferase [Thermoanaerobaculia bacterium]|nr:DegT/DnrJ/EryC1/StrS family aminotransferase [Thermoanaerobaculia bacterium]
MGVPLLDLKRQYDTIRDEIMEVTRDVYESQYFILGPRVTEFEENLAKYCGTKRAVGVSSGTDALLEALMVLGIGAGDEVIVPAYSFFATAGVVHRTGATPVFVDVEPKSLNIDPSLIEERITERTRAIIPVHLYGQMAEMDRIMEIATRHELHVIEDAAQAIGAELRDQRAGSIGSIGCFSFFPTKNLGGFGDGGAVTTNDDDMAETLVDFRVHGMRPKYYHHAVGGNFRLDALQAAILNVKLKHLDGWTEARQRNAGIYGELLEQEEKGGRIELPVVLPDRRHVFNQYVVRFPEGESVRNAVRDALQKEGIGTEIYYPMTLPAQKCFQELADHSRSFPVSEMAASTSLALPIFSELRRDELEMVAGGIRKALE